MTARNICKLVPSASAEALAVSCFVLESDPEIMQREQLLKTHVMYLVVGGEGLFFFDRRVLSVRTGSLVLGFSGELFSVREQADLRYIYIRFSGVRAEALLRRFEITAERRLFHGFDGFIPLWTESLARASEKTVDLAAESMLLYTLSRLTACGGERSGLVERVVRYTEERFCDPQLSLVAVAEALCYNPKYLSAAFKRKMGVGYTEYLSSVRIRYAITLFDHGIDSVKNVALLSGYADPLYFSSVFKRRVGISPTEYVKRVSGEPVV